MKKVWRRSASGDNPEMASGVGAELPATLRVMHNADGLLMGMVGPVCFALWQAKPTPERFAIQRTQLHAAVARDPGKLAFLCVVSSQADPPEDAERKASADMITSQGTKLLGVACVIEGVGFRAAITRTVLTGVVLLIRSPAPIKLFDSVRHASPFLARCLKRASLSELDAEFERARALLKPAARRVE
ncbi:MAG: hypothetical protein ABUL62_24110 [Myxococcales bacterium]